MKGLLLLLLLVGLLGGCATEAISPLTAKNIPQDRLFNIPSHSTPSPATATIVRDKGLYGSAQYVHFLLDGKKVAEFDVGERLDLRLDAGEYIFGVVPSITFDSATEKNIETRLESGKKYFYRILIDDSSGVLIQRYVPPAITQGDK